MILRHDGAPRGLRLAPPPAPTVGGVTVRVRLVADGLDVRRVFVGLARTISRWLPALMARDGFTTIAEAIGSEAR